MDRSHFFDRLYPRQDEVMRVLATADTGFYLSGGTAASARLIDRLAGHAGWHVVVGLREARFVRLEVQ